VTTNIASGLPSRLSEGVSKLTRLVENQPLAARGNDSTSSVGPAAYFRARSPQDQQSTIAIDGDRGVGKTTVLFASMEELASQDRFAVLPVLRPEFFLPDDSLMGVVLESLADYFYNLYKEEWESNPPGFEYSLSVESDTLARMEAASRRNAKVNSSADGDLDDLAATALGRTRRASEFDAIWRRLISAMLDSLGKDRLVIPIDDVDLAPYHLPTLLGDVRRLDDHPRITCVLALNSVDLADFLRASLAIGIVEDTSTSRVSTMVSRHIEKALPRQNWIHLPSWNERERLSFRPLFDNIESLYTLLSDVRLAGRSVADRIAFDLDRPCLYAAALPSRPRPLDRLAHGLSLARTDNDRVDVFLEAIREHLDDSLLTDASISITKPFNFHRNEDGLQAALDISQWRFYGSIQSGSWHELTRTRRSSGTPATTVALPRHLGTTASDARRSDSVRQNFAKDAVYAVLLILELESDGAFANFDLIGTRPIAGGGQWHRPVVRYEGEPTDDRFLAPPPWLEDSKYQEYERRLNLARDALANSGAKSDDHLVEWLVLQHFNWVAEIHSTNEQGNGLGQTVLAANGDGISLPSPTLWRRNRKALARATFERIAAIYLRSCEEMSSKRSVVFVEWYETFFLGAAHPALVSADLISLQLRSWRETVDAGGRRTRARARARSWLNERLADAGLSRWGDPVADCGLRLDLGSEFATHVQNSEIERESRRSSHVPHLGRQAVKVGGDDRSVAPAQLSVRDLTAARRAADGSIRLNLRGRSQLTKSEESRLFVSVYEDVLKSFTEQ